MKWKRTAILIAAVLAGVLTGCGASVEDAPEESPEAVRESLLQPDANKKYQYANDGAVYVDTYENHQIEQWSLDGELQETYTLPTEKKKAYDTIIYVNNEELFYFVQEEAGDDYRIMRVPIRQTEDGQELLVEQQEFLFEVEDLGYCGNSNVNHCAFYANQDYIVWINAYYVSYEESGPTGRLHVYDRKAEKELAITEDPRIADNMELAYYFSDEIVSVCSNVCGDRIIFNTDPLDEKEKKYGFSVYTLGEDHAEVIDERCYEGAAYITDWDRQKVYYQITEDQSVWEYDCESGEKRELIPEQTFRSCYEKEGRKWFPEEDYDSFFLQGDILYIIKERSPHDRPMIFSYSLEEDALQYEKAVTEKLHQCVGEIEQENGADRYFDSAITILEGKLLHYTDYEQYYCIDLETAEMKRVYADDVEKIYFALMGQLVETEADVSLNIHVSKKKAVEIPDPLEAEGTVNITLREEPDSAADCDDQEWMDGFYADLSFAGFKKPVFVSSFAVGNMTDTDAPFSRITMETKEKEKRDFRLLGNSSAGKDDSSESGKEKRVRGNCLGLLVTEDVKRGEDWEGPLGKDNYLVVLDYETGNCYRRETGFCMHAIYDWAELDAIDVTGDGVKELIAAQYNMSGDYGAYRCDVESGRLVEIYATSDERSDEREDDDWSGFTGVLKDNYQVELKYDAIDYSETVSMIEDGGYREEDLQVGTKDEEGGESFVAHWKDGTLQKYWVDDKTTVFLYTLDHVEHVTGKDEKPQVEFVRSVCVGHRSESIGNMHIYLQYNEKLDKLVLARAKYVTKKDAKKEAKEWWG